MCSIASTCDLPEAFDRCADVSVVLEGQTVNASTSRIAGGMQAVAAAARSIIPGLQDRLQAMAPATSLLDPVEASAGSQSMQRIVRQKQLQLRQRAQQAAAQACVRVSEDLAAAPATSVSMQVSICLRSLHACASWAPACKPHHGHLI